MKNPIHIRRGQQGEEKAVEFLLRKGWEILTRNWRPTGSNHKLELDVIAADKKNDTLVFVEIKTRHHAEGKQNVPAYSSFSIAKQQRILRAACAYLTEHDLWHRPCRFDLICLDIYTNGTTQLEHFTDVINPGNIMDSRNTTWQPW